MHKIFLLVLGLVALSASGDDSDLDIVNPFVCKPGLSYKLDCNLCNCGDSFGPGLCTLMACNLGGTDNCIPGSYFKIKGQLCACPKNGFKWDSNCFRKNFCRG